MKTICYWFVALAAVLLIGCAVMPAEVQREALPAMPFGDLVQEAGAYVGQTVVLGGYVVEVHNDKAQTRIVALEAPLGMGQEPKAKDLSQGRLLLTYPGFLDPEVYAKDRAITVGGKLLGSSATEGNPESFPYLRVEITEIHLWPVEKPQPYYYDPYWDYPWYPFHYPYYYPYWRHHPRH